MGSQVGNMVEMGGSQAGSLAHRNSGGATTDKSRLPGSGPIKIHCMCSLNQSGTTKRSMRENEEIAAELYYQSWERERLHLRIVEENCGVRRELARYTEATRSSM